MLFRIGKLTVTCFAKICEKTVTRNLLVREQNVVYLYIGYVNKVLHVHPGYMNDLLRVRVSKQIMSRTLYVRGNIFKIIFLLMFYSVHNGSFDKK